MKNRQQNRHFYKTLLSLGLPIVAQQFIFASLNIVDTLMIGQMGDVSIAAVGISNQIFFLMFLTNFGVSSASAIFFAQFWGKKDDANIKRVMGLSLGLSLSVTLIFTLTGIFFPCQVLSIFSKDQAVLEQGMIYLSLVAFSYPATCITLSFSTALRSINKTTVPMIVSLISLSLNTGLNYLLIFGKFGFPQLGVKGAAIATLTARMIEILIMYAIVKIKNYPFLGKITEMFSISLLLIKRYFKTALPVIFHEFCWSLGVTVYSVIYARMSTQAIASINIAKTVEQLAFVLFVGMFNAVSIMLGNLIGQNTKESYDRVFTYAKKLILIVIITALVVAALIVAGSPIIVSFFNVSPAVIHYAKLILYSFAFILTFKTINFLMIVGVFRSGGDTKTGFLLDLGGVWLLGIPLAILGGVILKLPIYLVYLLVNLEEFVKVFICIARFFSKKWIKNLVHDID